MIIQRLGRAAAWLTVTSMALATGLALLVGLALADPPLGVALPPWRSVAALALCCVVPLASVLAALSLSCVVPARAGA